MEAAHTFHKLWIIEALPDGDLKTGTSLYEHGLDRARKDHPDLQVVLKTPNTKKEVLSVLDEILGEAEGGSYPMIHFECHGCEAGLGSTGEELVSWDEIRTHLIDINRACRMNLVVVVAARFDAFWEDTGQKQNRRRRNGYEQTGSSDVDYRSLRSPGMASGICGTQRRCGPSAVVFTSPAGRVRTHRCVFLSPFRTASRHDGSGTHRPGRLAHLHR